MAIRRRCASRILSLVPQKVVRVFFKIEPADRGDLGTEEESALRIIETDLLDILSDEYCNRHLIFSLLETVLARIMPELGQRSVYELMEDRGMRVESAMAN